MHIIIRYIFFFNTTANFSSYRRQNFNLAVIRILLRYQTALLGVKMLKPDVDSTHHQLQYQETVPSGTH